MRIIIVVEEDPTYPCTYWDYNEGLGYEHCAGDSSKPNDWCGAH